MKNRFTAVSFVTIAVICLGLVAPTVFDDSAGIPALDGVKEDISFYIKDGEKVYDNGSISIRIILGLKS